MEGNKPSRLVSRCTIAVKLDEVDRWWGFKGRKVKFKNQFEQ